MTPRTEAAWKRRLTMAIKITVQKPDQCLRGNVCECEPGKTMGEVIDARTNSGRMFVFVDHKCSACGREFRSVYIRTDARFENFGNGQLVRTNA